MSPFDIVCAARMGVYKRLPYFMRMLYKLAPVEAPGAGTFFVDDKLRVHYDPAMVEKWGVEFCETFLAHEVQHPLREHIARGAAYVEQEGARWQALRPWLERIHPLLAKSPMFFWNVVADVEINPSVLEVGFAFPEGFAPMLPGLFKLPDGKLAEEYGETLFQRAEKMRDADQRATPTPAASNEQSEHAAQGAPGNGPDADGSAADESGDEPAPPRPFEGCCGSCSGHKHPTENELDESSLPHGATEVEVEVARRQVAHDTVEPTAEMKRLMDQFGRGTVPGSFERWAKAQLAAPAVPWQRVLAPLVRNAVAFARGRMDWKFGRQSRRASAMRQMFGDEAPILPGPVAPVPSVGILVDTSGSMQMRRTDRTLLDEALSEVVGIVLATGSPCWAAAVDADVQTWVRVKSKADADKLVKGGGGTDMRVGIRAADERKFDVIVLVTDGETPWPSPKEMPRHARLVTCVIGSATVPGHIRPVVRCDKPRKEVA
jgi:predicted metal-dependent peptidase